MEQQIVEGGKPVIIPNEKGGRTTPSVVAFTANGERLVGDAAQRQAAVNSARTISSVKRHMGTDWHINIDGKNFTPQEISAMVLRKLRADAEAYLGEEVRRGSDGCRYYRPRVFQRYPKTGNQGCGKNCGLER